MESNLSANKDESFSQSVFRPELLSRRGEYFAWGMTAALLVTWAILLIFKQPVVGWIPFVTIFLLFAATLISLGNWVDRHTMIRVEDDGIQFENGMRRASIKWDDIKEVEVFRSNWGDKVRVVGATGYFTFRTLAEVKMSGNLKGRMGFVQGEKILKHILDAGNLTKIKQTSSGYYYSRE